MLANIKDILNKCREKKIAVGAFNVSNLETTQAVIRAAVATHTPIIILITEKTLRYAGDYEFVHLVRNMIEKRSNHIPMGINFDHGRSFDECIKAIELGFGAVMIDGSALSFEENKNITRRVVEYAHRKKVIVQGELGTVPYLGTHEINDDLSAWDKYLTDPQQAVEFVNYTKVDTLAVGIGNAHGFQKEREVPDWERLSAINQSVDLPLILHGASDWTGNKIREAVQRGIVCFNVDTDIRIAFSLKLCHLFESGCAMEDPRMIMEAVRDAVQKKVEEKIRMFAQKI